MVGLFCQLTLSKLSEPVADVFVTAGLGFVVDDSLVTVEFEFEF